MNLLLKISVLTLVFNLLVRCTLAHVGFGVGVDITPGPFDDRIQPEEKKEPPKNPMVEKISERFGQKSEQLQLLWRRGYGYVELIKILLIAKEVDRELNEIVKQRDRRVRISKIAESYGIDYRKIYMLSYTIRSELEIDLVNSREESGEIMEGR